MNNLDVLQIQPTSSCGKSLMKMSYCPYCRGLPDVKPCNNYCMNIMKGCLAQHADLNQEWNNYISQFLTISQIPYCCHLFSRKFLTSLCLSVSLFTNTCMHTFFNEQRCTSHQALKPASQYTLELRQRCQSQLTS